VDTSSSYNLVGTGGSGGLVNGSNHNQVGVANPGLGTLASNGGPTQTVALLAGSPAIDAGDDSVLGPPLSLTTDQRGLARLAGSHVDIGAFEFGASAPSPSSAFDGITVRVVKVRRRLQLRVYDAATRALRFAVFPFGRAFHGRFAVVTRDVDGDGFADVIVIAHLGRKHTLIQVFSGLDGTRLPSSLA
jgi:hypothetical protein